MKQPLQLPNVFFDIDFCIVDTTSLQPYLKTKEGRQTVSRAVSYEPTQLMNEEIFEVLVKLFEHGKLTYFTNSPHDYALALIEKHKLPKAPLRSAQNKPFAQKPFGIEDIIIVGDSAGTDVFQARFWNAPSIGTTGGYSLETDLKAAGANIVTTDGAQLLQAIINTRDTKAMPLPPSLAYSPLVIPCDFAASAIGEYRPSELRTHQYSKKMLSFKSAKDYTYEDIFKHHAVERFFAAGRVLSGSRYDWVVNSCLNDLLQNNPTDSDTLWAALPNSKPHFCYKFDALHCLAFNLNKNNPNRTRGRVFIRTHPVPEAHNGGLRSSFDPALAVQYVPTEKNIILFDDITTSGSHLEAARYALVKAGYQGTIRAVCLARTTYAQTTANLFGF